MMHGNRELTRQTMRKLFLIPLLLSAVVACGNDAEGDHELGYVDFEVSCRADVRDDFDSAVALLHHMMYVESQAAFEEIAERAPGCAMAHWGIAMTLFQPLWPSRPGPEDIRRGEASVRRAMELEPGTDRELALVTAAEAFYREPEGADWWTRIRRFADAMDEAFTPRQDDIETGAFYALSQLAVGPVSDDQMLRQARAAGVLLGIHDREPQHPGSVHYMIHANDVRGRANESLDIVRSYDDIAPSVPHALHMPTHIFVRLGEWPSVIEWNRKSADAALQFPAGDAISHHFAHAMDYLMYAYLQRGDNAAASAVMEETLPQSPHQGTFVAAFHLAAMPARHAIERREWSEAATVELRAHQYLPWDQFWWPEAMSWFSRGLGAARTGDLSTALEAEASIRTLRDRADAAGEEGFKSYIETDRLVLAGWIAYAQGDAGSAVAAMREAGDVEASVQKHPVTPGALYPPYEALGDLLLALERPADALEAFTVSLEIWPERYHSLLGAARAARQTGDAEQARDHYEQLLEVVGDADTARDGVVEARGFVVG